MLTQTVRASRLAIVLVLAAARPIAAQSTQLAGTVTDSVHRTPLRGATVVATPVAGTVDSAFHTTHTDAKGQFALEALRPGQYSISVEHEFTDSIGFDVPSRIVTISARGTTRVMLALPSVATLRRTLCPAALTDTTLGVLLGVIRKADGFPAVGGRVVVGWTELSSDKSTLTLNREERIASTTTDSLGVYRACGVPAAITLLVQAQMGPTQSGVITERIGEAGVLVRNLTLSSQGDTAVGVGITSGDSTQGSIGQGAVTGSVVGVRGELIAAARVTLAGTTRSTTVDSRGVFRFTGLPTGTQGFEVVALGYLPRRFRAEVTADTRAGVIKMDRFAMLLDSMRVIARRQYDAALYPEFEGRLRKRGFGQFVTEEMIERRHPFMLSDMMRMMSGFAVRVTPEGTPIFQSNRGVTTLQGTLLPAPETGARPDPSGGRASGNTNGVRTGGGTGRDTGGSCIKLYVNGIIDESGDVNRLVPDAVHGLEVYRPAEAPAKYQSGTCGVVLIWSK
jgi:hypothetical protein